MKEAMSPSVEWKEKRKHEKKITVLTFCAMLFALCFSVEAQQSKKVPRNGYLSALHQIS